jgi:hypothetical protein
MSRSLSQQPRHSVGIRSFSWGCNVGNAHQTPGRNTDDIGGHKYPWGTLHWATPRTSLLGAVRDTMKTPSTGGAQTEPPEDAGPVRLLLGGEDSPADFYQDLRGP